VAVTRVKISKNVLQWALQTTDLTEVALGRIIEKSKWLQADATVYLQPTIKQLGSFATQLHIPFGSLLLDEPPIIEDIRVAFRTQKNVPAEVSLTVRDVIYEMKRKQAWFKEESQVANEKITIIGSARDLSTESTLKVVKRLLTLNHFGTARQLFNDLREQLAHLGILSMQKGSAGLGTNRPLDVSELRAFVLLDDYAPLIFINQKDSYTARVFSLVHEFIHILRGSDELLGGNDNDVAEERKINRVVAAFLMPEEVFKRVFKRDDLNRAAHYFNVSPEATVIRAKEIGIISRSMLVKIPDFSKNPNKGSGGNPYNTALSYNDGRYMNALISAQERGALQPTRVASLIGVSYKMLDKTVEIFRERETLV